MDGKDVAKFAGRVLAIVALAFGVSAPGRAVRATDGLTYVRSRSVPLPSRETAAASAPCPRDTRVLGGGVDIEGKNTATGVSESHPFDSARDVDKQPDDGWRVRAISRSAGDKSIRAYAICAARGKIQYLTSDSKTFGPGLGGSEVECPEGTKVTAGGIDHDATVDPISLIQSAPIDGHDGDGEPNDAWEAFVRNDSVRDHSFVATAICTSMSGLTSRSGDFPLKVGLQVAGTVDCPVGSRAIGGGAIAASLTGVTEIASSAPVDGVDDDIKSNDAWITYANFESSDPGATGYLTAYVICK